MDSRLVAKSSSRPPRGGVDRNPILLTLLLLLLSRPPRGGVDRNVLSSWRVRGRWVAPRVGAWIETVQASHVQYGTPSPPA